MARVDAYYVESCCFTEESKRKKKYNSKLWKCLNFSLSRSHKNLPVYFYYPNAFNFRTIRQTHK